MYVCIYGCFYFIKVIGQSPKNIKIKNSVYVLFSDSHDLPTFVLGHVSCLKIAHCFGSAAPPTGNSQQRQNKDKESFHFIYTIDLFSYITVFSPSVSNIEGEYYCLS